VDNSGRVTTLKLNGHEGVSVGDMILKESAP